MKKIIFAVLISIMLCACSKNEISDAKMEDKSQYILIDVRTEDEYNTGHIEGAINIPYDEINNEITISKDKIIYVYCQSGKRSSIAYNILKDLGYDVVDLGAMSNVKL